MHMRHKDITNPSIIMNAITQNNGWRLRPDQTILVMGNYSEPKFRLRGTEKAVAALVVKAT